MISCFTLTFSPNMLCCFSFPPFVLFPQPSQVCAVCQSALFIICALPDVFVSSSCVIPSSLFLCLPVCGMFAGFCSRLYFITLIIGSNFSVVPCLNFWVTTLYLVFRIIWLLDFQLCIKVPFLLSVLHSDPHLLPQPNIYCGNMLLFLVL